MLYYLAYDFAYMVIFICFYMCGVWYFMYSYEYDCCYDSKQSDLNIKLQNLYLLQITY